jgi:hypothetical protein
MLIAGARLQKRTGSGKERHKGKSLGTPGIWLTTHLTDNDIAFTENS